ncbi:lactonase, 7-bladed beta-propeller [Rhizoctonia solani 123E]|uniref:Lactonase, 7-bladed beta-propeller n=1 Tax=Rhizoctonia solani 123E TaxID=1423351 RepID=A0A074RN65_9AGAM|nr:lactonase, 7-bladed beta-propeller [Rhizoctonia solani 123E]
MAYKLLVGGYATTIATLLFNPASSSLSNIATTSAGFNPSWIATHPTNKSVVYATQETTPGSIISFVVQQSGQLTKVASVATGGGGPAHAIITSNGQEAVAMNYVGGSGTNIPLSVDKAHFGTPYPTIAFNGTGPNPSRQESSHPHQVIEYGNEYLVPDLGADKVWRLTKSSSGALQNSGYIQQPAGSGPRHVVTKGTTLYTLHELSSTLTQQTIPPLGSTTQPSITASVSIVAPGSTNPSLTAAELLLSSVSSAFPTQYLYATNRGDTNDAVAIVSIANNTLNVVNHVRTGVNFIRGAALSPGDGKYLAITGQNDGSAAIFERINGGTGLKQIARISGLTQPTSITWL